MTKGREKKLRRKGLRGCKRDREVFTNNTAADVV
jgi:hypothetical protein